ncbi:MAG: class I SAM-dependent methyltransferase [Cyanobacteriota bacterium]|jgi:trans-aconitate 2-methyltransferase
MQRTPEPELMEQADQVAAYAAADFAASDRALLERLIERFGPDLGARLVDLGCGPGNISFLLAERFPAAEVLGLDGSAAMLAVAEQRRQQRLPSCSGLQFAPLRLPSAQLQAPPLAAAFTAVISNSLLHHLHDPQVLWQAVRALAAPGAVVYVKDLRRPPSAAAAEALLARHAAAAPPVLQRDYLASLHAAFEPAEVEAQLAKAALVGLQVAPLEDRYLEVSGRLP